MTKGRKWPGFVKNWGGGVFFCWGVGFVLLVFLWGGAGFKQGGEKANFIAYLEDVVL